MLKLKAKWQTLEEALSLWTSTVIENGYALTGDAILAKSRDYAKRLEINDLKETNGWLSKFKKRYGLRGWQ
ncbi:5033_t:CDS:1, partial [Paraglomus occultum]